MRLDPDRASLWGGLVFVGFGLVAAVFAFGRDGCAAYAGEVPRPPSLSAPAVPAPRAEKP